MNIWLINVGEECPADPGTPRLLRTGILARSLAARGHRVTWWNATVNHQRKVQRAPASQVMDTAEGYRLILLHGRLYRRNASLARFVSHIENAREFARLAPSEPAPDVVLCGYPTIELAAAAVKFANAGGIPIAIDFRDMWPEVIRERVSAPLRLPMMPLFARWDRQQRDAVRGATGIVGITEPFVDWALAKGGRQRGPFDRAFHLAADPQPPTAQEIAAAEAMWAGLGVADVGANGEGAMAMPPSSQPLTSDARPLIGCFAGTFSKRIDLPALIAGAAQLAGPDRARLQLVFCGHGESYEALSRMASGQPHILLPGWRSAAEIYTLLRGSTFGMLPYLSSPDFRASFPNKVGEYLGAGLPIMTGLGGLTRTLLEQRNIGLFYEEGDAASAADCLRRIVAEPAAASAMRQRSLSAYRELFDPERIYPAFCDYLERLAADRPPEAPADISASHTSPARAGDPPDAA